MVKTLEFVGDRFLYYMEQAGHATMLLVRSLRSLTHRPFEPRAIIKQIHFIGATSTFVILVSGLFTGMVLALQFYNTLDRFGTPDMLGSATGIALVRELGPVMAALMVIARAGSAMCSELGIMRISEQIDALECMAIDPYKFLTMPKIIAGVISMPILVSIFDVVGIIGGWIVGVGIFGLSEGAYFDGLYEGVEWNDVEMGLYKSLVFGLAITWICSAKGFFLHLDRRGAFGAEGVSRATTEAVVLSAIAILFADYLIGALML